MKFKSYAQTDTGQVRQLNEDNMRIVNPTEPKDRRRRGELLVVADGMGGHDAGEVASSQAIETISDAYYRKSGKPDDALKKAIEEANAVIFERAQKEDHHGMGTTVVAAARIDDRLYIAHVGDSRLYLIRNGQIYALTNDHSLVAEQIDAGILTPEEALSHPLRNVISRAVGTAANVEVEISPESPVLLEEGDIVLLCSDGLTEHVRDHEIVHIASTRTPKKAAQALIEAANEGGGRDNITVIVGRVGDMPSKADATLPISAVSAPTKRLPAQKGESLRAPDKPSRSVFWLRMFLLTVIILGVGGTLLTRRDFVSLVASKMPFISLSATPTVTITLEPLPLKTFTPNATVTTLKPITPQPAFVPSATSTVTPTLTATVTPTVTSSATVTPTLTATFTPTLTPTVTSSATVTPTVTLNATITPRPTVTPRPPSAPDQPDQADQATEATATVVVSVTRSATPTRASFVSSTPVTETANETTTPSPSPSSSATPSPSPSSSATLTATASPTVSATVAPSRTPGGNSPRRPVIQSANPSPSATESASPLPSATESATATTIPTGTPTAEGSQP